MLTYEFINKEWIVSPTAHTVYRTAAYLSIMLFVLLCYTQFETVPSAYHPLFRALILVGIFGAATVFVGMEYFLFRFDQSHPLKQILWFCIMLFPLLAVAFYCLFVYSRSRLVKRCLVASTTNSSINR